MFQWKQIRINISYIIILLILLNREPLLKNGLSHSISLNFRTWFSIKYQFLNSIWNIFSVFFIHGGRKRRYRVLWTKRNCYKAISLKIQLGTNTARAKIWKRMSQDTWTVVYWDKIGHESERRKHNPSMQDLKFSLSS